MKVECEFDYPETFALKVRKFHETTVSLTPWIKQRSVDDTTYVDKEFSIGNLKKKNYGQKYVSVYSFKVLKIFHSFYNKV